MKPSLKGIDAELGRISKGSIETWEMEKAKNLVRSSHIYASETVQGRAQEIGYYATITGNARFSDRYLKGLDRVSKADVKRVTCRESPGPSIVAETGRSRRRSLVVVEATQRQKVYA